MSTIFDYLKEVTHDSIYDRPFRELDVLALTELTYLPFGHCASRRYNRDPSPPV